ncbi:MAG: PLP-dependent transferase, partial [Candidatus Eisenbacteria bacterium]|nr:PLP-dependent transferase [Candidatus Eisenbacteria bacterium]
GPGRHKGFEYSRTNNPTRRGLERCLAALEGGADACAFSSGLAATDASLASLMRPGQSIVAFSDLYGGTYRLLERVYRPWGLDIRYADDTRPDALLSLVDQSTRLLWIETPTNPLLRILDIEAISGALRSRRPAEADDPSGLLLAVDNTFASPMLQRPIELGADLVIHSATKYLGGHSDLVAGAVVSAREETLQPIRFHQNAAGAVPGPFDCFLLQRGLKTLHLRMERHCANALRIAEWSRRRPEFSSVLYPGLPDHPGHEVARRQMSGFGGMVTLSLAGGAPAAISLLTSTRLFACAESLGGVESLINHPATMTHASMPPEVRSRIGVEDGMVRLSVGVEDADDLIADLEQALRAGSGNP